MTYEVNLSLKPRALEGISEEQVAQHWRLYEGYVAQVNALRTELQTLRRDGKSSSALYADRRRRFGFEYNGMVLHELYFGNLAARTDQLGVMSPLKKALTGQFGTFDGFKEDFVAAGSTRSIGWAMLTLDPTTGNLNNQFVQLHEDGNIAGFFPILAMDVWEHAYMVDYGASGRADYITAFFSNVNWPLVEQRFVDASQGRIPKRL